MLCSQNKGPRRRSARDGGVGLAIRREQELTALPARAAAEKSERCRRRRRSSNDASSISTSSPRPRLGDRRRCAARRSTSKAGRAKPSSSRARIATRAAASSRSQSGRCASCHGRVRREPGEGAARAALHGALPGRSRASDAKTVGGGPAELARRGVRGERPRRRDGRARQEATSRPRRRTRSPAAWMTRTRRSTVARHVVDAGGHELAAQLYRTTCKWAPNRPEGVGGPRPGGRRRDRPAGERRRAGARARSRCAVRASSRRATRSTAPSSRCAIAQARSGPSDGGPRLRRRRALPRQERDDPRAPQGRRRRPAAGRRRSRAPLAPRRADARRQPRLAAHSLRARDRDRAAHASRSSSSRSRPRAISPRSCRRACTARTAASRSRSRSTTTAPRPRIRWPELEAGDTVEVAVRQWTSTAVGGRGDAPFYFMDYAGSAASHPLLYNEVIVETLPGHPLYVDVLNDKLAPYKRIEKDDKERGVHVLQLVWDKPLTRRRKSRSRRTPPRSRRSSSARPFKTWADFRKWYAGGGARLHRAGRRGSPHRRRADQGKDDARREAPRALRVRRATTSAT